MKVNEIFYSLQGEGVFTGAAAIFVRLAGCNLHCDFCDTKHEDYTIFSEDEFVKALFVNNVTVFINGSETGFYIDLDAEPDYFMGHLVCIEVDCKYKIEVGGFNG